MLPLAYSEVADQDLQRRVTQFLANRGPTYRDVFVHVHTGVVTLEGYVENWHAKQRAANCCRRVAGVRHLVDHIRSP